MSDNIDKIERIITAFPIILNKAKKDKIISYKELKQILDISNKVEIHSLIDSLMETFIEYDYIIKPIEHNKEKYLKIDLPPQFEFMIQIPLNKKDIQILNEILYNDHKMLGKILSKFSFHLEKDTQTLETFKSYFEEICRHNQHALENKNIKKKEIYFYYKRPLKGIELKKVIPIAIKEVIKDVYYIAGFDINNIEILKTYRLDRIISTNKIIETTLDLTYDSNQLESKWKSLIENNPKSQTIKFAYDPLIEINFENVFKFEKIPDENYTIQNETWKVGKITTAFPDALLEVIIPYAKLIYIIEPEELNLKIADYFKNLLGEFKN
ncbi:MAG: hypothetical protein KatS3mg129_1113 [Leptospiraceae bacterium]|nr:MAG: hypothetical protein KatS3mg129_1113 [Leptospiraceae bacterium]